MPPLHILHALRPRRAFTLVELLVVIGIIALIAGLLLPAVLRAYKAGNRTRMEADLHLIETALEAYKQDFGDYPRFDDDNGATSLNTQQDRGARLLCRALLAPGPASGAPGFASGTGHAPDGADGPGFRIRGTTGRVYGPYIQGDKFKLGNPGASTAYDSIYFTDATLLDPNGNSILYYPGGTGTINIAAPAPAGFVCTVAKGTPQGYGNTPLARSLYNAFDNVGYGASGTPAFLSEANLQYIMGDRQFHGFIDSTTTPPEVATYTGPYLLWTAGPDGQFGRDANRKTDDVTNFDIPPDLRK
jgi:prepilin-type N-terminal cleavage/methylation domain-containing protein